MFGYGNIENSCQRFKEKRRYRWFNQEKSALIRWNLTRHRLGQFSAEMRSRSGVGIGDDDTHEENKPAAMTRDEQQVLDLINHIRDNMTDPFDLSLHPKGLIIISTGLHATLDVQEMLLTAVEKGASMLKQFVDTSFSEGKTGSFYSPIPNPD